MGKRELFIAIAFVIAGTATYRLTAPPSSDENQVSFLARIWTQARGGLQGNRSRATLTHTGSIPVSDAQTELEISGLFRVGVRVLGEARADVSYEFAVISTGPDEETARRYAEQTGIARDDLGKLLALRLVFPREAQQSGALVLRVPARLAVRIEGGTGAHADHVAAVALENMAGDAEVLDVPNSLTGQLRNGGLTAARIGSVNLTLQRTQAKFDQVRGGLTLDARNGEVAVRDSHGALQLDLMNAEVSVADHDGPIRVGGNGGRIAITDPGQDTWVDVRNMEVVVALTRAVPLTLLTSQRPLTLLLAGTPGLTLDAAAVAGRIQADHFELHPEAGDRESRLQHVFGSGGPRVVLRNTRGEIVIDQRK